MNGSSGTPPYRRAALIAFLLLAAVAVYSFAKDTSVGSTYQIKAEFRTANQLRTGSEVRISGLPIGTVRSIEAGKGNTSLVTIKIDDRSVPIRADAKLAIEPRLALEGNYYVDVSPGSPGAKELESGATLASTQTSGPVQIDQVLDVFTSPNREALTDWIHEFAQAFGTGPGAPGETADGAASLRQAARELDGALGSVSQVARAFRGTKKGDLAKAVAGTGKFTGELATNPQALAAIVTNYRRVMGAFADNSQALEATIRELDAVARTAPASLTKIDAALPRLTDFASALRPTMRSAPPALRSGVHTLDQMIALFGEPELPRLVTSLDPAVATLPGLNRRLTALFPLMNRAMRCLDRVVIPALNLNVPDGKLTTGFNVWQEFLHMGAAFAGLAEGTDGNGSNVRLGVSEAPSTITAQFPAGELTGLGDIQGVDPTFLYPNARPPSHPETWCDTQKLPVLGARRLNGLPQGFTQTKRHMPTAADNQLVNALLSRSKSGTLSALKKLTGALSGEQAKGGER